MLHVKLDFYSNHNLIEQFFLSLYLADGKNCDLCTRYPVMWYVIEFKR